MKILKFKTNIDTETMLNKLASVLDKEKLVRRWNLDFNSPEKILSVSGEEITPDIITRAFRQAEFDAEMVQIMAIGGHDL